MLIEEEEEGDDDDDGSDVIIKSCKIKMTVIEYDSTDYGADEC